MFDNQEQKIEMVMILVDKFPEPRREKVQKMLEGPVGMSYFTSPASSREQYHGCYPGGLLDHSLNVVNNMVKIANSLCPKKYPGHVLSFVGLFHDLGKVGDGKNEYYVPNQNDWQKKRGELYSINQACLQMPNSERGLYILQDHGIHLSPEEYLAIRLNDGQYDDNNRGFRMKEPELALICHWADRWSCEQEKLPVKNL